MDFLGALNPRPILYRFADFVEMFVSWILQGKEQNRSVIFGSIAAKLKRFIFDISQKWTDIKKNMQRVSRQIQAIIFSSKSWLFGFYDKKNL